MELCSNVRPADVRGTSSTIDTKDFDRGMEALEKEDEPTLIVLTDGVVWIDDEQPAYRETPIEIQLDRRIGCAQVSSEQ